MIDLTSEVVNQSPPDSHSRVQFSTLVSALERFALPLFLIVLAVFFSINQTTTTAFTSTANIQNLLANQSVTGLVALAMIIPLVTGSFDLSVPAIAGLSSVTVASLLATHQQPVIVGLLGGLAIAVAAGILNGFLISGLKLNPFISTLGMYVLIGGLLQFYTEGRVITVGFPANLSNWASGQWFGIARPFWLLMIAALVTWFLLTQTPFGRQLAAIGSNESAARLVGIRVDRAVFLAFVLSGSMAGFAGVLLAIRSGGADSTTGASFLFPALAAVFLGKTAIRPGTYNVWGAMIGVFLVAIAINGFTLLGAEAWVTQVFNGGALLVAVAVSTLLARFRDSRARAAQLAAMRGGI